MRYFLLVVNIIGLLACSQKTETNPQQEKHEDKVAAPFYVPVPEGWTSETFPIPIAFAPAIPFKGVEEVRFTRDWAKEDSAAYWSYVFVWYLEGEENFNPDSLRSYLEKYYTGLVKANMGDKEPAYHFTKAEAGVSHGDSADPNFFSGEIHTLDYMKNNPFVLNAHITVRPCPEMHSTAVVFEISPQSDNHPIWKELSLINEGFRCTK
jgi:hypothetical protein